MKTFSLLFLSMVFMLHLNIVNAQPQLANCKGVTDAPIEILKGQNKTLTSQAPGYWEIVSGSSNVSCSGCYQSNMSSITLTGTGDGSASIKYTASDGSCCVAKPCNCRGCLEIIPSSGWQTCYPDWPDGKFEVVFCGEGNGSLATWLSSQGFSQYSSTYWTFSGSMGSGRNCSSQSYSGSGGPTQSPKLTACYTGGVTLNATLTLRDGSGNIIGTVPVNESYYSVPDCGSSFSSYNKLQSKDILLTKTNLANLDRSKLEYNPAYASGTNLNLPTQQHRIQLSVQENEVIKITLQSQHRKMWRLLRTVVPFTALSVANLNNRVIATNSYETRQVSKNASIISAGAMITALPVAVSLKERRKRAYVNVSLYDGNDKLIRSYNQSLRNQRSTNIDVESTHDGYAVLLLQGNKSEFIFIKHVIRSTK